MVSLWGSKDDGDDREDGDVTPTNEEASRQHTPRQSGGRDPDERTRLLPPRNDGFLDPDDPAVRVSSLMESNSEPTDNPPGISI